MNSVHAGRNFLPEPALLAAPQENHQQGTILILVVEDEDFVREVTCEVLLSAGYHVLRARTAAEALRISSQNGNPAQLLLTDVVLPGRSGQALAHELRTTSPGLKTIFISGYPENEIAEKVTPEPGIFYLPKPFSAEMLLMRVREVLQAPAISIPERTLAKRAGSSG